MNELMVVRHVFEGADLESVVWKGRPCWVARHIGKLLGYNRDGGRLAEMISADPEYVRGKDYELLTGDELSAYKARFGRPTESVGLGKQGAGLIVLFESGVYMALQHTRKPLGAKLRRFIADDVMPQLVRTGRYESTDSATPDAMVADHEMRLSRMEGALVALAQGQATLQAAVAGLADGIKALLTDRQAAQHTMTVTTKDTAITVNYSHPCPQGWIKTWKALGEKLGCEWTEARKRIHAANLHTDNAWVLQYKEPFVTPGRDGDAFASMRDAWAFHPDIAAELARREAPLFS